MLKTIVAVILIVLGIVAFAYQGVTYATEGRGVDMGRMHMATESTHRFPLTPIFGAIALIGGIAMLLLDDRDPKRSASRS